MKRSSRGIVRLALLAALLLTAAQLPAQSEGVVNINTAGEEELTRLPRVGPALASRIVEFREANGRFKAKEDLMLVRGIGESTYERLAPYVTVDGATTLKEPVAGREPSGDDGS